MAAGEKLKILRSVKQVAFEYGFKQVSHFSREFKLCFGVPPLAFLTLIAKVLPAPALRTMTKLRPGRRTQRPV